jgi:hypothetical protein
MSRLVTGRTIHPESTVLPQEMREPRPEGRLPKGETPS